MASGPDHYRRAEELLQNAYGAEPRCPEEASALAAAQVHAALANAAATALSTFGTMPLAEYQAWADACGEPEDAATAAGEDSR
jgi:hypothetical protein